MPYAKQGYSARVIRHCSALALCGAALVAGCSTTSPKRSAARVLVQECAELGQKHALNPQSSHWQEWAIQVEATIPADAPHTAAYPAIERMLELYGNPHARFISGMPQPIDASTDSASTPAANSTSTSTQPAIPTVPQGTLLSHKVAYLLLPGCPGESAPERDAYSLALRESIAILQAHQPVGWIVDLRLNGGGNAWPMLAGLWPLLGTGVQTTSIGPKGVFRTMGCDATSAWIEMSGVRTPQHLTPEGAPSPQVPVAPIAVLIGPWTMSSGELVAGALRGKTGTRLFGEPTAGLTTGTDTFYLSDGSLLVLPVDWMGDRFGRPLGERVNPTDFVAFKNWPTSDDAVSRTAMEWITNAHLSPAAPQDDE
jgi:hypothetical protein